MYNPYGADPSRFTLIPRVLVIAARGGNVLLLQRSPLKKLWPGLYNAPGGHVEQGETPDQAAARELTEETGLHATALSLRGLLVAHADAPLPGIIVFIYRAQVAGALQGANAEGVPHWIQRSQLPTVPTLPDLSQILQLTLDQPRFFYLYKTAKQGADETVTVHFG